MISDLFYSFQYFISQPWPWYVAGPMLALIMLALLYFGREFGISDNFRIMCAADGASNLNDFFKFDWAAGGWNLMVALGAMFGGYLAANYFSADSGNISHISTATISTLQNTGIYKGGGPAPIVPDFISWQYILTWQGLLIVAGGGFLVGFGSRYAGGCTSGHAISGLSALQLPSFIAVVGFFIGGLIMTHFILPLLFPIIL